jgi:hypothetical protein
VRLRLSDFDTAVMNMMRNAGIADARRAYSSTPSLLVHKV